MKNLTLLGLSLATGYVRAAVDYPHYLYRIGYQDAIIDAYDENDDLLLDEKGLPLKQNYLIDEANLFGSNTCVRVFEGANSISLWELPKELKNFPKEQTYGWIMYPGSNNCNAGKEENDPTRKEEYLSLEQGIFGWRRTTGLYSGGFPYPVSFRLWINPEIFNPSGVMAGTYPAFSLFGADKDIPSAPEVMNLDFARAEATEIDPNDPIAREYGARNMRIYQPEGVVDNIIAPLTRPRRGPGVTAETLANFRHYPKESYDIYDPRPPMEVFRPIYMLNRLSTDVAAGVITNANLDQVQLDAFFQAFLGPPIPGNQPVVYDWPNAQLRTYMLNLPGFETPIDPDTGEVAYVSPNGHTAEEALDIARIFEDPVNIWLASQDLYNDNDWGTETSAQVSAERWLYSVEEDAAANTERQVNQEPVSLQDEEAFGQEGGTTDIQPPPEFIYEEDVDQEIIEEGGQGEFEANGLEGKFPALSTLSGLVKEGHNLAQGGEVNPLDVSRQILVDELEEVEDDLRALSHVGVSQFLDQSGEEGQENAESQVVESPATGNILNQASENDVSFQSAVETPLIKEIDPLIWTPMTWTRFNKLRQKYPVTKGTLSRQSSISSIGPGGVKTSRDPGPE
ncbi:hypothetical protein AA313_de0201348 [Arthrobotrys entomopaga]|nr:hypothetical protein AA313_de0201348 [Arthrobotrys entomopaga]